MSQKNKKVKTSWTSRTHETQPSPPPARWITSMGQGTRSTSSIRSTLHSSPSVPPLSCQPSATNTDLPSLTLARRIRQVWHRHCMAILLSKKIGPLLCLHRKTTSRHQALAIPTSTSPASTRITWSQSKAGSSGVTKLTKCHQKVCHLEESLSSNHTSQASMNTRVRRRGSRLVRRPSMKISIKPIWIR